MRLLLILAVTLSACIAPVKKEPGDIILFYSFAKDSFLVRINNLAATAQLKDTVRVVYYADESLKSGKSLESLIETRKPQLLEQHYVFVGIAHFGNFRAKRRRDYITPSVKTETGYQGMNPGYGQADSFYHFLKSNIIPVAEKDLSGYIIERSFIGHSLGGLFATYLFINGDSLFTNLYALSPSLWIDNYHILNYENMRQEQVKNGQKKIWISCGGAEMFNRIRGGVDRIADTLAMRKYPGIRYSVKIYKGKTHNSSVLPALTDIFEAF